MRTGIFGGSFNPPHLGHLHLAESVHDALGLDEVWLVPSGISPHRSMTAYASGEDRLAMCRLMAEEHDWMRAEDYELRQDGISYTWRTLVHFAETFPENELFLLVGGDMLSSFTQWNLWQEILRRAALAAVTREPGEYEQLVPHAEELRQHGEVYLLNVESFAISSTKIRERIQKSQDCSCYLPEKIVQYIQTRNLYAGCDVECIR